MNTPTSFSKPKLLIGEGKTDAELFNALLKHCKLDERIEFRPYNGKDKLRSCLEGLSVASGLNELESIGITRDADNDAKSALQSVKDAVARNFPGEFRDRIKIFILPGAGRNGALEDLCLDLAKDTPTWECVKAFSACLAKGEAERKEPLPSAKLAKRLVRAWLCSLKEPDLHLALAAKGGHLNFDSPAFESLKKFLADL